MQKKPDSSSEEPFTASPRTEKSPPGPPLTAASLELAWIQAYQEAQRQLVDVQSTYQRSMTEAHVSFIKAMESSLAGLRSLAPGRPAEPEAAEPDEPAEVRAAAHERPLPADEDVLDAEIVGDEPAEASASSPGETVMISPETLATAEPPEPVVAPEPLPSTSALTREDLPGEEDSPREEEPGKASRDQEGDAPGMAQENEEAGELEEAQEEGDAPEETPRDEEAAGDEETPRDEEAAGDEEPPRDEETSRGEEPPRDEGTSRVEEIPRDEETTGVEEAPRDEETAGVEEALRVEGIDEPGETQQDQRIEEDEKVPRDEASAEATTAPGEPEDEEPLLRTGWAAEREPSIEEPPATGDPAAEESLIEEGSAAAAEEPAPAPAPSPYFGRFALQVEPRAPVGLAMSGLASASRVVVTDEGMGIAPALVEQLRARGVLAEVVDEIPADASGAIYLGGLRGVGSFDDAARVNREAFSVARSLAQRFTTGRGVFVTVQDTGGDFGISGKSRERAGLGGLAGLAKTARLEWPGVTVKAIDLERGGRPAWKLAKVLAEEIFGGGPELEVGLTADGERTTVLTYQALLNLGTPAEVFSIVDQSALQQSSVIVASGSSRGLAAAAMIAIARNARPRIVLLGRTPLEDEPASLATLDTAEELRDALGGELRVQGRDPASYELESRIARILAVRELRANLSALHQAGSESRYLHLNAQDHVALAQALAGVRRDWGPITGIVHGAGVTSESLLVQKTEDEFDFVFSTKVGELFSLLQVTAEDPLELMLLFSSSAARTGRRGHADFAMANEVLNKVAASERARRGAGCLVKALNWSSWEEGLLDTVPAADEEVRLAPTDVGARMLLEEIQAGVPDQVEVILGSTPEGGFDPRPSELAMLTLDAFINAATHPHLEGYRLGPVPILPLSLILEWFTRITRAHGPDLEIVACHDLKVLRPIRLEGFYESGDSFTVVSHQHLNGFGRELYLELYARDGTLRATATADMARPGTLVSTSSRTALLLRDSQTSELRPWPFSSIYGHALFQGPECQMIREIEGVSDEGLVAVVSGSREMGWTDSLRTDVAALDSGLQLAALWFQHVLGGTALVTSVGSYHSYFSGLVEGPIRAVLRAKGEGFQRTECDVIFVNENGTLVADLRGVEARAYIQPARTPEQEVAVEIEAEAAPPPEQEVVVEAEPVPPPEQEVAVEAEPVPPPEQEVAVEIEAEPVPPPEQEVTVEIETEPARTPEQEAAVEMEAEPAGSPEQGVRIAIEAEPIPPTESYVASKVEAEPIQPEQEASSKVEPEPVPPPEQGAAFATEPPPIPPPEQGAAFATGPPPIPPPEQGAAFVIEPPPIPPPEQGAAFATEPQPILPPEQGAAFATEPPPVPPPEQGATFATEPQPIPPPDQGAAFAIEPQPPAAEEETSERRTAELAPPASAETPDEERSPKNQAPEENQIPKVERAQEEDRTEDPLSIEPPAIAPPTWQGLESRPIGADSRNDDAATEPTQILPLTPDLETPVMFSFSPDWQSKGERIIAALAALLARPGASPSVLLRARDQGEHLRFVGGPGKLYLDLAGGALDADQMSRAEQYFAAIGVEKESTEVYEAGQFAGRHESFGLELGADAERATRLALDVFSDIYQLPDDFTLEIQEN